MDIKKIRDYAKLFLQIDPKLDTQLPGFVHHPFFNSIFLPRIKDGEPEMFNLLSEKEEYQKWQNKMIEQIDNADIWKILYMMNSPYYMNFMIYIQEFLDDKELGEVLKYTWTSQEFPNWNDKDNLNEILNMFKRCKNIMSDDELKIYNNLSDKVEIYRGQNHEGKRYKALSWTLDYDKAYWFSTRFQSKGKVYKTTIDKKNILCILNNRGEMEAIVDYKKLRNIEEV